MRSFVLALSLFASAAYADGGVLSSDVVFLGETHDNPAHHTRQAELVAQINPKAIVWEMVSDLQVARITPALIGDPEGLEQALDWAASGWPDFAMYYPIFAAAPDAAHFAAALPRDEARAVMGTPIADVFGSDAARFGLDTPLPEAQQTAREALQLSAHCDAMPAEMLPIMVDIQRIRDAKLARAAATAFETTGGPVVVITGNGHARTDWGAPAALRLALPDVSIFALGQAEDGGGLPDGAFDQVDSAPAAQRDDPCEAFRTK